MPEAPWPRRRPVAPTRRAWLLGIDLSSALAAVSVVVIRIAHVMYVWFRGLGSLRLFWASAANQTPNQVIFPVEIDGLRCGECIASPHYRNLSLKILGGVSSINAGHDWRNDSKSSSEPLMIPDLE
jgi:hypothetical protein